MKFTTLFVTLAGALPYLAHGAAVPGTLSTTSTELFVIQPDKSILAKRADEWEMVIYTDGQDGQQCGGGAASISGSGSACWLFEGIRCLNVKVNFGVCQFEWKGPGAGCSGDGKKLLIIPKGTEFKGVGIPGDVHFLSVECHL